LLYCVYSSVIGKNTNWQEGIVSSLKTGVEGTGWSLFSKPTGKCNDGQSLCQVENGTYTCAPPSLQLISRWNEIDLNGDGVWTEAEVYDERENLKCKYAVDPLEVFNVMIGMIKEREKFIWLHPDVKQGRAISKTYFTYVMGDLAMCGYRNQDMCGNLLKRKFFDVPLKTGKVPRVGGTVSSALDYCQDLLAPRGTCERLLPSTYQTWKIEGVQECQDPVFNKFVYIDPSDGDLKSLLEVDYNAVQDYQKAQTRKFLAYKCCIIFLWIVLIVSMLREVSKGLKWVYHLPYPSDAQDAADEEEIVSGHGHVHSMSLRHRVLLLLVFFLRVIMLLVLMYVGLSFLGRQTDYVDLLLDSVAFVFIVEVGEILYQRLLRQDVRVAAMEQEPMEIEALGNVKSPFSADVMDYIWLLVIAVMAIVFLAHYTTYIVAPLTDALQCTCLSQGESCHEAHAFSKNFWDNYWRHDVPSAIAEIKGLEAKAKAGLLDLHNQVLKPLKHHHPQAHL